MAFNPSVLRPVAPHESFPEAVAQLAGAVAAGAPRRHARLPAQEVLAARLDISRGTLAEVLDVLTEAGVIESTAEPTVRTSAVPFGLVEERALARVDAVAEALRVRRAIEPRVARLAALRLTQRDLDALRRTIEDQRADLRDRERFLRLDVRFHLALARAAGNATLVALMRRLLGEIGIARDLASRSPEIRAAALHLHERTLGALTAGDSERLDAVMADHLAPLEREWERAEARGPGD